ncbi:ThiF family adenylyltransferase, partial [Levilactobacillus brevis]|nr:ThiF family adenylyltransferase [Levilactobacillus brevis]
GGKMYRLQDFITVKQINQKISIEYRVKIQFSVSEDALRFINQLKSGECSFDNVGAYEDVLKKLIHLHYAVDIRNMLPKKAGNSRLQYYLSYYVDDPIKAIEKLKKARIAILGLGGVGTIILQNLVGNGIEQFVLVDFDKVESSNHNRQFIFKDSDVGSLKTKACSRYVKD